MSMAALRFRPRVEALEDRVTPDATTFVTGLYLDVLGRAPDPAGLTAWTSNLNSGAMTHAEVAAAFWFSEEHRTIQVTEYYDRFLDRAPAQTEVQFWVDEFRDGDESEFEIMERFLTSQEYVAQNPLPSAYVTALYQDVLGRAPDPGGFNFWVQQVQNGDNTDDDGETNDDSNDSGFGDDEVVEAFLNSDEHLLIVIDQYYTDLLHRTASEPERQGWLNVLRDGNLEDGNIADGDFGTPDSISDGDDDEDEDDELDDGFLAFNDEWSFEKLAVMFLSSQEYITTH